MIYQAVGYKRVEIAAASWERRSLLTPRRRGERTSSFNVASAQADWLSQEHPDLIWGVETVGASQQVRR